MEHLTSRTADRYGFANSARASPLSDGREDGRPERSAESSDNSYYTQELPKTPGGNFHLRRSRTQLRLFGAQAGRSLKKRNLGLVRISS